MPSLSKKNSIFFGNKPRQLKTLVGEIHLTIPRLQCKACGKYFLFTETEAFGSSDIKNLAGANITPALRRIATLCGASWPFQQAEKVIKELTGVEVSHDHIQNLCASEAKAIDEKQEQAYDALVDTIIGQATEALTDVFDDTEDGSAGQHTAADNTEEDSLNAKKDRFYIGMDGVYIGEVDKNKHIEAKVGLVFTDERATISKGRNILLNKQYVGTFHDSQKFSEKLYCCAKEMGIQNQTELVILGDGARWVNRIAQTRYPKATLILDWWHLKRRVWETADYLKRDSLSEEQVVKWGKELVYSLWCGDTNKALTTILKLSNEISIDLHQNVKNDLDKRSLPALYHYIKNNQSLILDYQSYKQNGYFISSDFAEKAIDVLVCRRQKRRGMNWSLQGAENILILRQLVLNQQWDSHWQQQMAA
ncbi:MAG: ISKra4 family transposase [Candidatus Zixiibacteriota bacterium]